MPVTNLHKLITHQTGWLNTSRPLTADDLHGRIILLDFWTYCCINCMHVIPDLHYLEETFGDKLTVIGVHSAKFKNERDSANIREAILRLGLHHPVVNDFDFSIWNGFGIHAWPTFVLINPLGTVEEMYSGEGNREAVAHDITALIKKYDGRINTTPLPIALEKDKQPPTVLAFPTKLATDGQGHLFVADSGHQRIAVMTLDGEITDSIGSGKTGNQDGSFENASFHMPQGLAYKNGLLYIADTDNHELRVADLKARNVTTLAGTGEQGNERSGKNKPAMKTALSSPWALAFYPDDSHLVIAMAGTHQLWSYDTEKKTLSLLAGNSRESIDDGAYPYNSLAQTSGLSAYGSTLYFVDAETSSLRQFKNDEVKTLIGTGLFDFGYKEGKQGVARMQHPIGVFASDDGIFIADSYNHSIRRYDVKTGELSNFAGHDTRGAKDGALATAEFNEPNDVLQIDGKLYIADTNNNAIRVIDLKTKQVATLSVQEKQVAPAFSDNLPNLEKTPAMEVASGSAIDVAINVQKGWHVNAEAPSNLTLFDADKKAVASFDVGALQKQNVTLPALKDGNYRLQATLYYCEDKAGAQCLLKSFDMPITAGNGSSKTIALKLN